MRPATVVVIVFVVIVAAIVGVSTFLSNQPPLQITVAADPLAENWLREAARRFNETETIVNTTHRVRVEISTINDPRVWSESPGWTLENHPDGWLASSSASVSYLPNNLSFEIVEPSTARTPLVWGGFSSRVDVITDGGQQPFEWDAVARAAAAERWDAIGGQTSWQFVKLAFNPPSRSMSGLAVLLSGAAYFHDTDQLSASQLSDSAFINWMRPIIDSVPNFQTLSADPAATMAGRGASVVEIAMLPESQWLMNLDDLPESEALTFHYPVYQFLLDFPLAAWSASQTDANRRAAVAAFGDYLLSDAGQSLAMSYGLRPADAEPSASDAVFARAESYGFQLVPDYGLPVALPSRNDADGLVRRFG